jgi:hypothetical protein
VAVHTRRRRSSNKYLDDGVFVVQLFEPPWPSKTGSKMFISLKKIFAFFTHKQHIWSQLYTTGLPDFSLSNIPKREKYTKWPQNVPVGQRIYQMAVKYSKWT